MIEGERRREKEERELGLGVGVDVGVGDLDFALDEGDPALDHTGEGRNTSETIRPALLHGVDDLLPLFSRFSEKGIEHEDGHAVLQTMIE